MAQKDIKHLTEHDTKANKLCVLVPSIKYVKMRPYALSYLLLGASSITISKHFIVYEISHSLNEWTKKKFFYDTFQFDACQTYYPLPSKLSATFTLTYLISSSCVESRQSCRVKFDCFHWTGWSRT